VTLPSAGVALRPRTEAARFFAGTILAVAFVQATVVSPGDVAAVLAYTPTHGRWWAVFTHPLVHGGMWTAALNALVIAAYGGTLERRWGRWEYVRFAAACALGTWAAHAMFGGSGVTLQGGAGVAMGTVLAYATERHDASRGHAAAGMTPAWLAAVTIAGLLLAASAESGADPAAALAHLGGLAAGWAYLRIGASISLARLRDGMSHVPDEPDEMPHAVPRTSPRAMHPEDDEIVARSNAAVARQAVTEPTPAAPAPTVTPGLDQLLDKISAHGLASLTPEERRLLDEAARRLRDL
jgi:membrane associated rhomboid family serine protease